MVFQQTLTCSLCQERLSNRSVITGNGARLDVTVYGIWGGTFEKAFLDLRV